MREFIIEKNNGTRIIKNLEAVWIQPMMLQEGYMLCYKDDIYDKGIICRSTNMEYLEDLEAEILDAYSAGKKKVWV